MKHPNKILTEERAVSPVVGVALLIAIAVILAAVVGAVVLGLGTSGAEAPQASVTFENDTGNLNISHDGGEALNADNVVLRGPDGTEDPFSGELTAGETVDTGVDNPSGEYTLVWQDPESDDETEIGSETFG